ncbi:hypothetical protein [Rhizobium binxianense]
MISDDVLGPMMRRMWGDDEPFYKGFMESSRLINRRLNAYPSIDVFLNTFNAFTGNSLQHVAIPQIALRILDAERESRLSTEDFQKATQGTHYEYLGNMIFDGVVLAEKNHWLTVAAEEPQTSSNIKIISFNYDRSLEFYLVERAVRTFEISHEKASNFVKRLNILHPYGIVANLPHFGDYAIPFGEKFGDQVSSQIAVFSSDRALVSNHSISYSLEREDDNRARDLVKAAEIIVFLGFAFHHQNMLLLEIPDDRRKREVYASAYGFAPEMKEAIEISITSMLTQGFGPTDPALNRMLIGIGKTAAEVLRDYSFAITAPRYPRLRSKKSYLE